MPETPITPALITGIESSAPSFAASSTNCLPDLTGPNVITINHKEVEQYLAFHPDLRSVLGPICSMAREAFGEKAELELKLYRDPEMEDEYLTLYVRQVRYEADIMDRIETVPTITRVRCRASAQFR